ncbi:MAG: ferredoxin, adrenodoxin-like protein [Monoraphidium minutum]|nr:MAG: ferredoxin, adrenodoxin-like protein [Monoraphidium minutum]
MLQAFSRALLGQGRSGAALGVALSHQLSNPWVQARVQQQLEWQQRQAAAAWHSSSGPSHGHSSDEEGSGPKETISVTFDCEKDGSSHTVQAPLGKSLLEVAHDNDIELEGACEGSLACSTCHVIVEGDEYYKKLPEATEDELDMLDLAYGLTDTSRLGCQVIAAKDLEGLRVKLPSATRNFYVDGHVPKPH